MSPNPPQAHRTSNSSSPVSSSHLSDDEDGAPRSDTATVGSNKSSVIGDVLIDSSFASVMEHSHETVTSRTGQQQQNQKLPPLYPAAASSTSTAATTTTTTAQQAFAGAGMQPPENRAQAMPLQRSGLTVRLVEAATTTLTDVALAGDGGSEETSLPLSTQQRNSSTDSQTLELKGKETGNIGAVVATATGGGGGYQSGASSIKSCGSITGSEADERGETTSTMANAVVNTEDVDATDSEDDHDCGGSLDVEANSVATMRSLHSQIFQEHEDLTSATADTAAAAATSNPASPRENVEHHLLPQGMALSREDGQNELTFDTTSMARYARSRSPDHHESQGKSSRVRRSPSEDG